ncbi:MAG: GYD domain-containing protein [Actinomycetota bacterium]|nr:GYD domain-containing protein [Actinomycetota bacterium]
MPHYMISGSYTAEGAKALLAEGGTSRLEQAKGLIESLGGTLEAMYFTFGSNDIVGFCELPNDAAAAAASLSVSSSSVINVHVTAMLTGQDLDDASSIAGQVQYRPPGQ